ncbi:MAG: metal ABC transporter ATP-binding protein [Lentisphaerota bacterium]
MIENKTASSCGACCTRIVNLGVSIGSTVILENINLHMHCGQLTALVGPNGAGKTTLLRAMLREIPHTGELHFIRTHKQTRESVPLIGYVPQKLDMDVLSPVTVRDLFCGAICSRPIWLGTCSKMGRDPQDMLALVGANHLLDQKIGQLSVGQLQRVLLALALTPVPEILLLDEPVAGVDVAGIEMFYQIVSRLRRDFDLSILLISHDLAVVSRFADRMVFLNHTIQCEGTPAEVIAHPLVRQAFGLDIPMLAPNPGGAA